MSRCLRSIAGLVVTLRRFYLHVLKLPCWALRYEPWTIVDRMLAPWHDVRFRGYGQNKIVHIAHMNATSFKFVVLGNAFIVHR